jgi:hypothetical protein
MSFFMVVFPAGNLDKEPIARYLQRARGLAG